MLSHTFHGGILPNVQTKHPLGQTKNVSSFPFTHHLRKETDTLLTATSFLVLECDKFSLHPSFLQTKQPSPSVTPHNIFFPEAVTVYSEIKINK